MNLGVLLYLKRHYVMGYKLFLRLRFNYCFAVILDPATPVWQASHYIHL